MPQVHLQESLQNGVDFESNSIYQLSMASGKIECHSVPGRVSPATSCVPARVDLADLIENGTPVLLMTI